LSTDPTAQPPLFGAACTAGMLTSPKSRAISVATNVLFIGSAPISTRLALTGALMDI
jgi:hypothetical protein